MNSALYTGTLMHGRYLPRKHAFVTTIKMLLLDLDELDSLFTKSKLWVRERFGFVSFKRKDYLPDGCPSVKEAVIQTVASETGVRPEGPVFMLTNLRYWGLQFNPASFFYCFDKSGETLTHILIEVHNTPWGERHRYVLPLETPGQREFQFNKEFHVSPFNPMDMKYICSFSMPAEQLSVQMENHKDGDLHFKAVLKLTRDELNPQAMTRFARNAWKLPFRIMAGIYWQAARLMLKRVPFYNHPQP
ncbi:MAG: DUF1365 domain-containing protein [bacterium]